MRNQVNLYRAEARGRDALGTGERLGARLPALDALRGLLMILMALDHARSFIARDHPSEFWGMALPHYEHALPFITRLVTHLCAPGFFFLLGAGVMLFAEARRRLGWSEGRITGYLLRRGLVLILLQLLVENPAWLIGKLGASVPTEVHGSGGPPGGGEAVWLYFGVLYGLGTAMIACSILWRFKTAVVLGASIAALAATQVLLPGPEQARELYPALYRLLLIPGQTGSLLVLYPLLPWLGIAGLGVAFGRWLLRAPDLAYRTAGAVGATLLFAFAALRYHGGWGDFHPLEASGWIPFFNVTKYPPSLSFVCLTLGINGLLLAVLARGVPGRPVVAPLLVFGRTALFFYLVHLYLYGLLGYAFPAGASFAVMYSVWLLGLAVLYPLCLWYGRFKHSTAAESLWRLL